MELDLRDLRRGYAVVAHTVLDHGSEVGPRGLKTRELTGVTLTLPPDACLLPVNVGRGVNLRLAALEALQLVGGVSRHDLVVRAAPDFGRVLVDPANAEYGAYGPRLASQVPSVVDLLRHDPDTRRAVLAIWRTDDLNHDGDRPCTVFLQLLLRDGRLELHSSMRSQDVWLGLAYDCWMFGQLRDTLARWLRVEPGRLVHHVGSLHLYEPDYPKVADLSLERTVSTAPELPRGVVASPGSWPWWTAVELLNPEVEVGVVAADANPWYATQIRKLK